MTGSKWAHCFIIAITPIIEDSSFLFEILCAMKIEDIPRPAALPQSHDDAEEPLGSSAKKHQPRQPALKF